MRWSDRQSALLAEMGLRLWRAPYVGPTPDRATDPLGRNDSPPADAVADAAGTAARPPSITRSTALPASGSALAADVHALDWPVLRAAVAGCTACTLCRSRTQTVFGCGHPRAHWMVIGEAPGEQEDEQGEPFVGRTGQLLDNMLRAIGLSRQGAVAVPVQCGTAGDAADPAQAFATADPARHFYVANAVKCRPPDGRNPAPDELQRCAGYLIRQIELVQPRIILAMGHLSVQSLLRSDEPIGRLRGRVHRFHDVPLVVTYPPAYLLRYPLEKARAWDDLCLALDALQAAEQPPANSAAR